MPNTRDVEVRDEQSDSRLPRANILVVEDDAAFRELVCFSLGTAGFATDGVASVNEARARLARGGPYDLVISDVRLPNGSGIDLLFAEETVGLGVPVLMMTAFGSPELEGFVTDMGSALLKKPFALQVLHGCVRALLAEAGSTRRRRRKGVEED